VPALWLNRRIDDDTISGVISEPERNWTLELLVEVLSKAVAVQRWADVARVLARVRANVEAGSPLISSSNRNCLSRLPALPWSLPATKPIQSGQSGFSMFTRRGELSLPKPSFSRSI